MIPEMTPSTNDLSIFTCPAGLSYLYRGFEQSHSPVSICDRHFHIGFIGIGIDRLYQVSVFFYHERPSQFSCTGQFCFIWIKFLMKQDISLDFAPNWQYGVDPLHLFKYELGNLRLL